MVWLWGSFRAKLWLAYSGTDEANCAVGIAGPRPYLIVLHYVLCLADFWADFFAWVAYMNFFAPCINTHCALCGSDQSLSGEHKIKASALRSEFGRQKLVIGRGEESYRLAQGVGSKAFHFSAPLCGECNNARTQPGDMAFDQLHECVTLLISQKSDPADALQGPRFASGGTFELDVFRYFAKLLCCHLAELGAPFQSAVADFAIGFSDENCISLGVDLDPAYARLQSEYPGLPYAAHGGLIVLGDKETLSPVAFHSTLTVGPARYRYQAGFTEFGQIQLEMEEPEFVEWCRQRTRAQLSAPLSDQDKIDLGL